jgi:hypothetical protein
MAVIISHRIKRKEFKKGIISPSDLQTILGAFKEGIFTVIKGDHLPKGSRLIKIYATTVSGARRIVFLIDVASNDAFFLFYRSQKDKIGKNITIQNQDFRKMLHSYLSLLDADLDSGSVDVYKI